MAAKRSLFSKPKWAAAPTDAISVDRPFFKQAIHADTLELIRLEREKEKKKKRSKDVGLEVHKLENDAVDVESHSRVLKKPRLSLETDTHDVSVDSSDEDDDFHKPGDVSDSESARKRRASRSPSRVSSPTEGDRSTTSHAKKKTMNEGGCERTDKTGEIRGVTIDDEDQDDLIVTGTVSIPRSHSSSKADLTNSTEAPEVEVITKSALPAPESEADSEDDEYLKVLRRKARAEAAQKKRRVAAAKSVPVSTAQALTSPSAALSKSGTDAVDYIRPALDGSAESRATTNTDDPEVQILIRSIIPNTSEVIVRRLASQPLDKVHSYWCERNEIAMSTRPRIFFIWRLQKLFNTTTMRGILRQIERTHGTTSEGGDLSEGKIVIEAVTQEILEHRLQQRERDLKEKAGLMEMETSETREDQAVDGPTPVPDSTTSDQRQTGIVISLVAPGMAAFKLRVRADSAVSKIIRGYRSKNGIEAGRSIYLVFDGERLEDDRLVGDTDLEDGDSVDVRIT